MWVDLQEKPFGRPAICQTVPLMLAHQLHPLPRLFQITDDCVQSQGYYFQGQDRPVCPQPNGFGILPNCTAKPTAAGGGPGTIMGYCDELKPDYEKNVALTFGLNHPCEWLPARHAIASSASCIHRQANRAPVKQPT